jgi:hypothetical protein
MAGYIGSKASVVSSGAERKKTFTITGATTNLTGLNYTVGKVHVFQNGVRLVDGTDYTATNGTTITLTVAAQSGDNVVVISQASFQVADALLTSGGTMTGDLTVQGAFTSQGIDDNADAVALTIDSNENVLIGKTSDDINVVGHQFLSGNAAAFTRANGVVSYMTRNSSDGEILRFRKDSTTVGSIQARYDYTTLQIGSTGTGITGTSSHKILPSVNNARSDNTNDLGSSTYRWKDLYISGAVYLGGVGSANKLEDFEEGTWTPNIVGSTSGGWTSRTGYTQGYYTKIGSYVHLDVRFETTSRNSPVGNMEITGLPFPAKADTSTIRNQYMVYTVFRGMNPTSDSMGHIALLQGGNSHFNIYQRRNNSAFSFDIQNVTTTPGNCEGHFHISYRTN